MKFSVVVVDDGTPVRGAIATVDYEIDNSCLMDVEFKDMVFSMNVDNTTGQVFLVIPGYFYNDYRESNILILTNSNYPTDKNLARSLAELTSQDVANRSILCQ